MFLKFGVNRIRNYFKGLNLAWGMKRVLVFFCWIALASNSFSQDLDQKKVITTYVVTSSGDESDSDINDGIFDPPTLRSAIENANHSAGTDVISFSGITSIVLSNTLPSISEAVIIDGELPNNGKIILNGGGIASHIGPGLTIGINADFSSISNISLVNFSLGAISIFGDGVELENSLIGTSDGELAQPNGDQFVPATTPAVFIKGDQVEISNNVISGNYGQGIKIEAASDTSLVAIDGNIIGLDSSGVGHLGNMVDGIEINQGAHSITGNIISDNGGHGISISGDGFSENHKLEISGNFIGLDKTGTQKRGNEFSGIFSERDYVLIEENVISHNLNGIDSRGEKMTIKGNFIGTDGGGLMDFGNEKAGIVVWGIETEIGGAKLSDRNIISGNDEEGILVYSSVNFIENNFIGLTVTGDSALANTHDGIKLAKGNFNDITNNTISGNGGDGIEIDELSSASTIKGNLIGVDSTGAIALGNLENGILAINANELTIGDDKEEERNIISNNGLFGVHLPVISTKPDTLGQVVIDNNYIGLDKTGEQAMGNGLSGISIGNVNSIVSDNVISTNGGSGISVEGKKNVIVGNIIGADKDGLITLGNQTHGIELKADSNLVGSTFDPNQGNQIAASNFSGILVFSFSSGNTIGYNLIGVDINGETGMGNSHSGITFGSGSDNNTVLQNVISGNQQNGIRLINNNDSYKITGNYIGTDATGLLGIPNQENGILINKGDDILIGLPEFEEGNLISGNGEYGIKLIGENSDSTLKGIFIRNNIIGVKEDVTGALQNGRGGILSEDRRRVIIGGKIASLEGNIISGNDSVGVYILDKSTTAHLPPDSIWVLGNYIGINKSLHPIPNIGNGVAVSTAFEKGAIFIGKAFPQYKNIVASNMYSGLAVVGASPVFVEFSEFFDNAGIGVDLDFDGVTLNDPDDGDEGANGNINFPITQNATYSKLFEELTVFSALEMNPQVEDYYIDYFYNEECDESGFGEAQYYLNSKFFTTDASGMAEDSINISLPYADIDHLDGIYITTSTFSRTKGSSEFSECFYIQLKGGVSDGPDLILTKTDSLEVVEGSDVPAMFTYQIKVKNIGLLQANDIVVTDSVPESLILGTVSSTLGALSVEGNTVRVDVDSLAPGDSLVISIPVEVEQEGLVINTAMVSAVDGEENLSNNMDSDSTLVSIITSSEEGESIPDSYTLSQNYPNPFNPTTNISYSIPEQAFVELKVYNLVGVHVATLVRANKQPGNYTISWDASAFASGVYFYRLETSEFTSTKRMLLIK